MRGSFLQAALNGARDPGSHPALPLSPDELAADAARCWAAGATGVHVHPRNQAGEQSLSPGACGETVAAIRAAVRDAEISLSTAEFIDPDVERRIACVRAWAVLPDVASVNLSEDRAADLCRALWERGVDVEAGLASTDDARLLASEGLARYCRRALIEVEPAEPAAAVAAAEEIDALLDELMVPLPRLWHGVERATWAVVAAGARARRDLRIGLEDTLELPDGREARGNDAMVLAVDALMRRATGA
jgi:uncharacterized protein (DUF849 family)